MIAEIQDPFVGEALNRKIDYQLKKIESGVARELYNSSGDSLINMYRNMSLVAGLNDRVKSPYIEFILSSPIGVIFCTHRTISPRRSSPVSGLK